MDITILACGKIKKDGFSDLIKHYEKQLKWKVSVKEINISQTDPSLKNEQENKKLLTLISDDAYLIVMDETGKNSSSKEIAKIFSKYQQSSQKHMQIVIGGSSGLCEEILDKASIVLSFGKQTWPHKMVRPMLFEQIYRAQTILDGHPYHKE